MSDFAELLKHNPPAPPDPPRRGSHGFLWSDGEFTSVDSAPGASFTNVTAISTRGEMVGRYTLNGVTDAYLRSGGQLT